MGLQDNRILSIPRHVGLVFFVFRFLSPLVWGGPSFFFFFFSVLIFLFFLQSSAANIICTNWRSETKKNQKLKPQQQQKIKKTKTDLKPNSQTTQRYTVTCWRVTGSAPKAKSAGIVGPLAHLITRRHAHGTLHSQKHRTAAHNVRR